MTVLDTKEFKVFPGVIPSTPIIWPADKQNQNRIQQTKGNAQPQSANGALPTTQPSVSVVPSRTTPQHVSHVRVVSSPVVAGQKTIRIQFNHPAGDPHFQGASVYLRRAGGQPTLVASGNKSPLSFTVPVNAAAHAIHVTSWGPWGETNVLQSPAAHVKLV
jgi:hypothetical protein